MQNQEQNVCSCWPLSSHYFLYFSLLGTILPYLALYLSSLEFSPIEIGQLMAVFMLTKIIAPNIWGVLADRNQRPIFWVRVATFAALVLSIGLWFFEGFWSILAVLLCFSFFWHASLPQFESYTFKRLAHEKHRYGQIRLWGSLGFIFAVLMFGALFEYAGVQILPWVLSAILLGVWGSTYLVHDQTMGGHSHAAAVRFITLLKRPEVIGLLIASFLIQVSHGVYYSFFTIQMTELGMSKTLIAWLWALGVMAEIAVFWWMARLFQLFSVRYLLLFAIVLTVLRWLLTGYFAEVLWMIVFAQLLHAASFGMFHAGAIYLIDRYFSGAHHGKGQALFAASSHGLGGALGMLIAGYSWQYGGAPLSYSLMAIFALLAGLMIWRFVQKY